MCDIKQILIDKYTAAELVELLDIGVEDILDIDGMMGYVVSEFHETGLLCDEWREYYNE